MGSTARETRGCDGVEVEAAYTFANPSDIVMFFYFVSARRKVIDRTDFGGLKTLFIFYSPVLCGPYKHPTRHLPYTQSFHHI